MSGKKKNEELKSFFHLAPSKELIAAVNVIKVPMHVVGNMVDGERGKYTSKLVIHRQNDQHRFYGFHIEKKGGSKTDRRSLKFLTKTSKERNLNVVLFFGSDEYRFAFAHKLKYLYFSKIFEELEECIKTPAKIEEKKIKPVYEGPYWITKEQMKKIAKKFGGISSMSSGGNISKAVSRAGQGADFYTKKWEKWSASDFMQWTRVAYVEEIDNEETRNVIDVLPLKGYLKKKKIDEKGIINAISSAEKGLDFGKLYQLAVDFKTSKKVNYENLVVVGLIEDVNIRNTIIREFKLMREFRNFYPINFAIMFRKALYHKKYPPNGGDKRVQTKEQIIQGSLFFSVLYHDILTTHRSWWDVATCRDEILVFLLCQNSFDKHVELKEAEFEDLVARKFQNSRYSGDEKQYSMNPSVWEQVLLKYNRDISFKLEDFSFPVYCYTLQNKLRKKRRVKLFKILKEEAKKKTKYTFKDVRPEYIKSIAVEKKKLSERIEEYEENVKDYEEMLSEPDLQPDEEADIKKELDEYKNKLKQSKDRIVDIEHIQELFSIDSDSDSDSDSDFDSDDEIKINKHPEINILNNEILDAGPGYNRKNLPRFMLLRRAKLRDHIKSELVRIYKKGLFEIPVVLVSSIKTDVELGLKGTQFMGFINRYATLPFFRWGPTHASVHFTNCGLHWSQNETVAIHNLSSSKGYRELFGFDAMCPIFSHPQILWDKITKLAEFVVSTNINKVYKQHHITGVDPLGVSINCQEFAKNLLKELGQPENYPEVDKYIKNMVSVISSQKIQKEENARFITVSTKFKKAFSKVLEKPKFKPDENKRVYFNSHQDVDDFYSACDNMKKNVLEMDFPGFFLLIKGFDRSYWILEEETKNCPFASQHKKLSSSSELMEELELALKMRKVMIPKKKKNNKEEVEGEDD